MTQIKQWLSDHGKKKDGTKLALLIVGPPGCGKTAAARLVSETLGYSVQEFNMTTCVTGKRDRKTSKTSPNKVISDMSCVGILFFN